MTVINDCPIASAPYKNSITIFFYNTVIKKICFTLISFLISCFLFLSCKKGTDSTIIKLIPASIAKNSRETGGSLVPAVSLTLKINQTDTLLASIVHSNQQTGYNWTSSNTAIATVDQFGVVKGISPGTALITASTTIGNASTACRVTVDYWNTHSYRTIINCIAIDFFGFKWCGSDIGLSRFNNSSWSTYNASNSGLPGNHVHDVKIDAQGKIWLATENGVSLFDGINNWTTYSTSNSGLANNFVNAIAIDLHGNKWFGTNSGISKFDGANWISFLPGKSIYTLAVDEQGTAWIAGEGFWSFNGNFITSFSNVNMPRAARNINSIAIDAKGNKWLGTDQGLVKFKGTNWVVYTTENSGLANNRVTGIAVDKDDNKWISTLDGVSMFDNTNWVVYNAAKGPFAFGTETKSIVIDQQGFKWVGVSGLIQIYNRR